MTQIDVDKVVAYGAELPDQSVQVQKFVVYVAELEVPLETFERQATINATSSVSANRNIYVARRAAISSSSSVTASFSRAFGRKANISASSFVEALRVRRFGRGSNIIATSNVLEGDVNFVRKRRVVIRVKGKLTFNLEPENIKRKPTKDQTPRRRLIDKRTIPVVKLS